MRKKIGLLALLALGVVAMLAPAPAAASCGTNVTFGQGALNCGGSYCYVVSPGLNNNTSIQATFWDLNFGNPSVGPGIDNGAASDNVWLVSFGGPNLSLLGDWSTPGVDGCVDCTPPAVCGGGTSKMVLGLSDVDAAGNAFFATTCVTRNGQAFTQFDQSTIVPHSDIILQPLPAANITGSVRVGTEAQVTVSSPNFASIFYSDGSAGCAINTVIPQYDLWIKTITTRNDPPPSDHSQDTGAWTLGATCNIGSSCTASSTCGTGLCDGFVAVSPHYNSNFQTGDAPGKARLAANSVRFQSGQTLADPPRFKPIPKGQQKKLLNN